MYKTILVHVDQTARSAARIDLAARLAMQCEAHLIGAATTGISPYLFPVGGLEPGAGALAYPIEEVRAEAVQALDAFDERARLAGVASFERRLIDDEAGIGISLQARYCDLVIVGQSVRGEFAPRLRSDFPEYVMLNGARPVLLVPAAGAADLPGQKIAVAWNGSPDAVRAVTSAIPMLRRAQQVDLVVFDAESHGDLHGSEPGADIALYLARHGVKVDVHQRPSGGDVGEALLSFAAAKGADLIVMGAYGHPRIREIMLGGATRTVVRSSPVAVWMAH